MPEEYYIKELVGYSSDSFEDAMSNLLKSPTLHEPTTYELEITKQSVYMREGHRLYQIIASLKAPVAVIK